MTDTLVAGVDGLLIVAEARIDPEGVSALAAAHLGLAHTTAAATGQGAFRHAVVHSSGGYLAVYSVDRPALVVVLGDEGLDLTHLFIRDNRNADVVAVVVCPKSVNIGMLFAAARRVVKSQEL